MNYSNNNISSFPGLSGQDSSTIVASFLHLKSSSAKHLWLDKFKVPFRLGRQVKLEAIVFNACDNEAIIEMLPQIRTSSCHFYNVRIDPILDNVISYIKCDTFIVDLYLSFRHVSNASSMAIAFQNIIRELYNCPFTLNFSSLQLRCFSLQDFHRRFASLLSTVSYFEIVSEKPRIWRRISPIYSLLYLKNYSTMWIIMWNKTRRWYLTCFQLTSNSTCIKIGGMWLLL